METCIIPNEAFLLLHVTPIAMRTSVGSVANL